VLKVNVILCLISWWISIPWLVYSQDRKLSAQSLYEKGIERLNDENYTEALSLFNECIRLTPKFAEAYAARAEVRERLHDLDGAMIDYAICVELLPDQFEPLFSLAVIRYELKLYELAKLDFLKLQHLSVGETNRIIYRQTARGTGTDKIMTAQGAIQSELYNYLGLTETQLQNCRRGISYMDSAIQLNPNEADYYVNRALAKHACKYQTAQEDFKRALVINPDHSLTRHNLAVQSNNHSFDHAENQLTEIIQSDSTLQYPFIARGYYRLMKGDYNGAQEDYTNALGIDDQDPHLWLNRGMAKEKLDDLTGAFRDYTQAIELKENFANAWLNRGNVLSKQKRYVDAIEDYSVALVYQPDYGHAYFNRALANHNEKKAKEACEDLKKAEALGMKIEKTMKDEICKDKKSEQ